MKIAVCVCTAGVDTYGHLTRYARQFERAAQERGIVVEILLQAQSDFCKRLWENLSDENCIVHFYGYIYDLRVGRHENQTVSAVGVSRAKTIATIGDHLFSAFMQTTLRGAHPNTGFIVLEKSFQDQMQTLKPELTGARYEYQPIAPPVNYEAARCRPFDARNFDLIVPMYITDMSDRDIRFILSTISNEPFARTIAATYEIATSCTDKSPFHIFDECLREAIGLSLSEIRLRNPAIIESMLLTVAAVDALVRQERRQKMLNALLRSVDGLKVVVTCDPCQALNVDESITFLGQTNIDGVIDLVANAKAILNCNPSYPSGLHERLISGMLYQSCVITDVNPCIAERFSPAEYVRCGPGSSMTLQDIFHTYDIEAVATRGYQRVHGDTAFSWQAHIDGLMRAAA